MTVLEKIYKHYLEAGKISTDSRKIEKGCLFFALKGANFNGNQYATQAIEKGAAYAVVDQEEFATSDRTILVKDVLQCLQELASHHRQQLGIPMLAITGSNGKTTTKELIAAILSNKYKLVFTQGNLNNHIGVPLTLLSMDETTEFAVVEMGANHPGEIATLCQIADPDFGIITNIGKAHLEGFGSFEGVVRTKGELYEYIGKKNGTIFYNSDNPILEKIGKELPKRISYGKAGADLNGEPVQSPPFIHVKVNFPKGVLYLNSKLTGDYNFENILAAACIGNYFGVDPLQIQKSIKQYTPDNNRSQLIQKDGLRIVMDAYNANPTSMKVSIESFAVDSTENTFLILGDMLELGKYSAQEHRSVLELLKEKGFKNVFLVGGEFTKVSEGFDFHNFKDVNELGKFLQKRKIKNGNILVKGSRGIQLEKVLDFLN